ncbi:glucose-6-phosphate isomerase [Rhodobacteraceae bacterium W635]|uniref:glycine zipper 2TM domain-containing protein n=1 Tax=Nioella halotolerans TaxID=2303578 RepID=UPI000E3BAC84|nr:glucose-6-phosphate isomerase [Rhodobacteraceae bacterium W635]
MKKYLAISVCVMALAGATCTQQEQQIYTGAAIGAVGGFALAELFDANSNWTAVSTLAGAAVGAEVARNNQTGQCAYKRPDGRVNVRPC